jgi:hypothetical protein
MLSHIPNSYTIPCQLNQQGRLDGLFSVCSKMYMIDAKNTVLFDEEQSFALASQASLSQLYVCINLH